MASAGRNNSPLRDSLALLFLAGWLLAASAQGQSVILHLRNGDRLSGQLLAEEPARLTLTNSILGRVVIPLTEITRRESLTNAVGTLATVSPSAATNKPAAPALVPALQKKLNDLQTIYAAGVLSAGEFQRQRSQIVNPPQPSGPKRWSAEVFAGLDLLFSKKDHQLYTGRAKLTYVRAPLRNNIDYLFTYGYTDSALTANRMDGWMKTDLDISKRAYVYSLGGAGYDAIRLIDWRYEIGPGLGYHLIKATNFVARVEAGVNYQVQNFEDKDEEHSYSQRLAQDIRWNIGSQFTFDEKAEYFPELNDLYAFKVRVEANLRYWLRSNLSLNLTVIDTYDTRTADGIGQNDLQVRSSIGVKF
jgi:Protein of unknown function, DUF481